MLTDTPGLHHVTGIVGDAQQATEFYAGVLGLRLVTQTVNVEAILQHHRYFGDSDGMPGTVLTQFPDPHGDPGRVGKPQAESVAFAVPDDALEDDLHEWRERFGDRALIESQLPELTPPSTDDSTPSVADFEP